MFRECLDITFSNGIRGSWNSHAKIPTIFFALEIKIMHDKKYTEKL